MRINDDENAKLLLDTVPRVMRSIREEMRGIARGKFTVPQFRILNQLRKRALTNSELAEWMGVTAPTMSRMLEPLEEKGYIIRTYNPNDRRSQSLSLSASGKREAEKIRRQALECFSARLETLSGDDSHALANGLKVLSKLFEEETSDAPAERNKSSMKIKSMTLLMLLGLATSLSSCLGDKTAEDYANEQSRKEQAKLQEIADTYNGTLVSTETGQSLGSLTLILKSDTDVQDSGVTKVQVPSAKGALIYNGLNKSQVTFKQYYYDSDSKLLQIQVPIEDASKTTQMLSLRATLKDKKTLEGEIEVLGGYSGTFSLVRKGPIVQAQNLSAIRGATAIAAGDESFVKTLPGGGIDPSVKLKIKYPGNGSGQLFLNLFMPERKVNVTLILRKTVIDFADDTAALLDERYNTLKGDTAYNNRAVDLECDRTSQGTPNVQWNCKISAGDAVNTVVFGLDKDAQTSRMN